MSLLTAYAATAAAISAAAVSPVSTERIHQRDDQVAALETDDLVVEAFATFLEYPRPTEHV